MRLIRFFVLRLFVLSLSVLATSLWTHSADAAKNSASSSTGADAGCGLGSMLIHDNTKVMQILAATTNVPTQTFAISTGTSNCKSQNLVMADRAVQYFVEVNRDDLSREISKGEGEKLQTLAALYGCDTKTSQALFSRAAKAAYLSIIPKSSTDAQEMVTNLNLQKSVVGICRSV